MRRAILQVILAGLLLAGVAAHGRPARSAPPMAPAPAAGPRAPTGSSWWLPGLATPWQWQLSGTPIDSNVPALMIDLDLFETSALTVTALHQKGYKVVCYVSAGSWEDWRPDANQFPAAVIGSDYEGWPGEKWLDIRRIDLLGPIMGARFDQCKNKGFDGIEPDNVDGYANNTGFAITATHQLTYNRWLAQAAHARSLSIGLKNDGGQVADLLLDFDWALVEDCFAQKECDEYAPFVSVGKAVFAAEYTDAGMTLATICPQAHALHFNAILKHRNLDAWRESCPGPTYVPLLGK